MAPVVKAPETATSELAKQNPYGDGNAAGRIEESLRLFFSKRFRRESWINL
jgi:hypothetical protein